MGLSSELSGMLAQPGVWASIAAALLVAYLINFVLQVRRLPPGPFALPFIGNIPQLRGPKPLFVKATEWSSKYGDPLTLWVGPRPMVFASTKDSFRDISGPLRNHVAGRMQANMTDLLKRGYEDVSFGDFSPGWDVLRRLNHVALRKFAQTDRLAQLSRDSVSTALDKKFSDNDTKSVTTEVVRFVNGIVDDILAISAYGGFDKEIVDDYVHFRVASEAVEKDIGSGLPSDIMPILGWIFFRKERRARSSIAEFAAVLDRMFAKSAETYVPGATPRHFTDVLLQARDQFVAEDRGSAKYLTMENLRQAVLNIFGAGTGTSRTIISYCLLVFANDPKLQEELRDEVISVLGDGPCLAEDRPKLPLLNAFIQEILRFYPAAPLSLPRKALADVTINGHSIPKGTGLFINVYAVNRDPEIWGKDANEFDAKRFLSASKDQISRGATAFGIGARSCIGEKMALADFIYVLVRFLQRVRVTGPKGPDSINLNPADNDILLEPIRQDIVFEKL